jgi:hypothetical protein
MPDKGNFTAIIVSSKENNETDTDRKSPERQQSEIQDRRSIPNTQQPHGNWGGNVPWWMEDNMN